MRFDRRKDIHPKYLLLTFTIIGIVLIVLSYAAAPKSQESGALQAS